MVGNRSAVNFFSLEILLGFALVFTIRISQGYTNPSDVAAINSLYVALGSPSLPGWVASGGDPCGELWQGVVCEDSSISSVTLIGANLGGELGDSLGEFSSIKSITLSNNLIGGSIPTDLPATLVNLSLNNNELSGEIPDAFEGLPALINLDLSSNNLSGQLPPSMQNLSGLTTLHLQNNQLSGTLDVLQDLPLKDLDIRNNLFSGPIPPKILSIPNFRRDGNPFNSSAAPLPPPTSSGTPPPGLPFFPGPASEQKPPPWTKTVKTRLDHLQQKNQTLENQGSPRIQKECINCSSAVFRNIAISNPTFHAQMSQGKKRNIQNAKTA
ncbi:UNVERIFIED_CONTAM: protein STRUBBELIG-RECEPTOR FAMILY 1 [Sesamum calycinum]|uniref:Protein STRUBBELIG-RECEPTOR FAMILY 1 n=1 Tax=Sesamum calycinum TaxID=2727403 RepID=A0AAW2M9K0_9LAMI